MLLQFPAPNTPEVDLKTTYDAVVVGSGAAGGMAAHALTAQGLKVLVLEAGKHQDTSKILHSMQWPYDHPRRGGMPPDYHALTMNEYNIRSPYGKNSPFPNVESYIQGWGFSDYSKTLVVNEKEHPYTGTRYAWVRSRAIGGKTNIWGRPSPSLVRLRFQSQRPRWLRRELAHRLCRRRTLLRQGGSLSGRLRIPRKPAPVAGRHFHASHQVELHGAVSQGEAEGHGPDANALSCRRCHRDLEA